MIPAKTDQARFSGLRKLQKIIEPTDSRENPQKVDVVVSTVHRAKGLEWPKVRAGDDFFGPRKPHLAPPDAQWILPSEAEVNIAYIAVTRAQAELDMGSLDWIDKWVPANDPEILEKPSRI
jgi:superfamily I DNA/RNA helicase